MEDNNNKYNWELLWSITQQIPDDLDREKRKEKISQEMRQAIYERDRTCRLCDKGGKNLVIHHIIPNSNSEPENLILLCKKDHIIVHMLLAQSGKWKDVVLQQMFGRNKQEG